MDKLLIAEYKPWTPYNGKISNDRLENWLERVGPLNPWMISINIDERWAGSYFLLARALGYGQWPVMANGTNVDIEMALKASAEWAVTRDLHRVELSSHCIYELIQENIEDGWAALDRILINGRNQDTGKVDYDFINRSCDQVEDNRAFVTVTGGFTGLDDERIPERANAVLIGTAFMRPPPKKPRIERPAGRLNIEDILTEKRTEEG